MLPCPPPPGLRATSSRSARPPRPGSPSRCRPSAARPARSRSCSARWSTRSAGSASSGSCTRCPTARCCPGRRPSSSRLRRLAAQRRPGRAGRRHPVRPARRRSPCSPCPRSTSRYGDTTLVESLFLGLAPAVIAIVVQAVVRVGRRALGHPALVALAVASFVALTFFAVPFPVVVAGRRRSSAGCSAARIPGLTQPPSRGRRRRTAAADQRRRAPRRTTRPAAGAALILVVGLVAVVRPGRRSRRSLFGRSTASSSTRACSSPAPRVVTFGGAYAVLAYVAQQAVNVYGWLLPGEMVRGLALAETTPGPLIMVVQFVAFVGAYRDPGDLDPWVAAVLAALLTTWVTFVPCFLFILLGAPYVERLRGNRALAAALTGITAAVVGVIANLAVFFAAAHALRRDRQRSPPGRSTSSARLARIRSARALAITGARLRARLLAQVVGAAHPRRLRARRRGDRARDVALSRSTCPRAGTSGRRRARRRRSSRRPASAGRGSRSTWWRSVDPVDTRTVRMPASSPLMMSVSIRSPTITVVSECASMPVERAAHHQRVGLADEVGLAPRRGADQRGDRPGRRQHALGARPAGVGVGGDEARAVVDQPDRPGDRLERVGAGLAEHDVVGVAVGHHVADVVQRRGQPRLADDVRRTARPLVVEELRGGEGRRPDRLLRHVDPAARAAAPAGRAG